MSTSGNSSTGTGTGGRKSIPEFAASLIGTTLDDRFRIDSAIGQGAMGTVFAATQLSVNRRVAVKVLREQISETSKKRFMREARAISSLNHPNIVQLVDFGEREVDGLLYLVMEYVEGLRMSRLNKKGRLHPNLIIELVAQICSALAEAHSHGIVHRDLKPSNILLVITADGSVQLKVLDFGVAHTYEDAAELTATGVLCGTPAYMAPEQARGKNVSPSVDLYALGVNMYQMLAGFRPFRGATPVEVAMKQIQATPPSLRQFVRQNLMPEPLVELTARLMAKEPELRPRTASEVRQRVLQIRRDFGWGPLVFDASASDAWSRWTQQRLAEHGGRPLREEIQQSKSWSESWSGQTQGETGARQFADSQVALHDASGVRRSSTGTPPGSTPTPARTNDESSGHDSNPSGEALTVDSLPSRHGGGWDAFRQREGRDSFPSGVGSVDPHVLEPTPASRAHPDEIATPSEETAHIYNVANAPTPDSGSSPASVGGPALDAAGEYPAASAPPPSGPRAAPVDEDRLETVSTSASYQEMWQSQEAPAGEAQESDATENGGPMEVDHMSTLVANPARREGTLVSDMEEESGTSATDVARFALIAVFAFAVFIVLGWFIMREKPSATVEPEAEYAETPGVKEELVVEESEVDSEKSGPETARPASERPTRKSSKKNSRSETKQEEKPAEPIDLFGDEAEDRPSDSKIIIEEKR
jgi:serine/threonine protein kinase